MYNSQESLSSFLVQLGILIYGCEKTEQVQTVHTTYWKSSLSQYRIPGSNIRVAEITLRTCLLLPASALNSSTVADGSMSSTQLD